jgi:hypothetical protein
LSGANWDLKNDFGVSLSDGAISTLLAPPALKERISNTSRLEKGRRVDIEAPVYFDSREITLEMHMIAPDFPTLLAQYRSFIDELTYSPQGVQLRFYGLYGITVSTRLQFNLQFLSCTPFAVYGGTLAKFAVRFIERNPDLGRLPVTLTLNNDNEEDGE